MNAKRILLTLAMGLAFAAIATARTIVLTGEDVDKAAVISDKAPRVSWACIPSATGVYDTGSQIQLYGGMAILMRFPLDAIPKDQKIVKAELTLNCQYVAGPGRTQVRRMIADWGPGVCHQFSRTFPKKVEWSQPGGTGAGTDRAAKDSAMFKYPAVGDHTVDVTEDVELWYTGAAPNRGWMLTADKDSGIAYLAGIYSPHAATAKQWKLQITFEPQ